MTTVSIMAVTESGHLASRQIDDLYRAHGADVYRYAYAVVGNRADAEDVTQTTFLNAYRALEQGVRPRKPSNWLLAIASNAIKQRFRQEQSRPRQVELDERLAGSEPDDHEGPSVGELLTALSKIPPQQRQAIVLREFEGRSYAEIAEILGVTTSALETLLFRARRSLAEELEHQLTCTEAQLAISRSVDGRLGRKERRRLRDHLDECPDCSGFVRMQQKNRSALRGLALVPVPISLSLFKGLEGTASAAVLPSGAAVAGGAGATALGATAVSATAIGSSVGTGGGGILAGGIGVKVAAVAAAATVAGGVGVAGSSEVDSKPSSKRPVSSQPGERLGQVAPRGVLVPGKGVAVGKANAPGQTVRQKARARAAEIRARRAAAAKRANARATARGQEVSAAKRAAATQRRTTPKEKPAATAPRTTNGAAVPAERSAATKTSPSPKAAAPVKTERATPAKASKTRPSKDK